jgi:anthranilate phosphoribosyltransferase
MYAYLYQDTATNYTILHSLDGYDEVSLTCPTKVITPKWKECSMQQLWSATTKSKWYPRRTTIEESAQLFITIISGKGTAAQKTMLFVNAGMAIATVAHH